jgi:hypothetical protein
LGASTVEAQLRVAEEIADQFVTFFKGEGLVGAVNAGQLAQAMTKENRPLLILARSLGIAASIFGTAPTISVQTSSKGAWVGTAVLSGFMSGLTNDPNVNLINGPALAKANGVSVTVTEGPFTTLAVTINNHTLVGELGSTTVALLQSIDGGLFIGGLPLDGPLAFFTGPAHQPFAPIEAALAPAKLVAANIHRSTGDGGAGGAMYVARTQGALPAGNTLTATAPFAFLAARNF